MAGEATELATGVRMPAVQLATGVRMPAVQLGTFRTRGAAVRSGVLSLRLKVCVKSSVVDQNTLYPDYSDFGLWPNLNKLTILDEMLSHLSL